MPSFFSDRAASLYYYATHKVLDADSMQANMDKSILEKIKILSIDRIDETLLVTIVNSSKSTEPFSLIGSPAPTYLPLRDFRKLSSNNPFSEDENILVAVEHIHQLHLQGLSGKELALTFLLGDEAEKVKLFAPMEYKRAYELAEEFELKGY